MAVHATSMSDHPSSPGSPPIPSSSLDPNLLSPPTSTPILPSVFYSQSTPNRPLTPPPNAFIPTSTPISNKTSGNHSYASETHDRDSANYRLAQETSGHFLGPMPPQIFLDMFHINSLYYQYVLIILLYQIIEYQLYDYLLNNFYNLSPFD